MVKLDIRFSLLVAREMLGRCKGDAREMEGRWKGDGREMRGTIEGEIDWLNKVNITKMTGVWLLTQTAEG